MNYTCGVFAALDADDANAVDKTITLEQAQLNKLEVLSRYAHIKPGMKMLDIGCGWGADVEYQALQNKAQAHGITLSEAQCAEIRRRNIPGVTAEVCNYLDFKPAEKFDAIISICMMEHIVSPLEVREGKAILAYRNYLPRDRNDLKDIGWVTYEIFPGGITPRLEEIITAVNPYWEVIEVKTRRTHYEQTTAVWLERLQKNEAKVRAEYGDKVFDDYVRYLSTCVKGFQKHYQSLAQYSLKRID